MCNYGQETQRGGLINGELARINSATITEGLRRDVVMFVNGMAEVQS